MTASSPNASSGHDVRKADSALLASLRARIRRLEGGVFAACDARVPLKLPAIDAALPEGGLPRALVHEILGDDGVASGFCAALVATLAGESGWVLWCRRGRDLYGPGLAAFGLDTSRLIVVRARTEADIPWAMEEGLRSGALAAVVGEVRRISPITQRRLQLAAEAGGVTGILRRPARDAALPACAVRWRIAAAGSQTGHGRAAHAHPRWRVELLRCRGGVPTAWLVEWCDGSADRLVVVAELRRGSADATADPKAAVGGRLAG